MKQSKDKFLWTEKKSEMLQFWPKNDKEVSLTKPFLPKSIVNTPKYPFVKAPKPLKFDYLNNEGIKFSAFTEHSINYLSDYDSRKTSAILYTISGEAKIKSGTEIYTLTKGSAILLPTKSNSELRIKKKWSVFWVHLKESGKLNNYIAKTIIFLRPERFEELLRIAENYKLEIYRENRNYTLLESLAKVISEYIRLDFAPENTNSSKIAQTIRKSLSNKNAKTLARELSITIYELNKISNAIFGENYARASFSKKMKEARTLLKQANLPIKTIAQKLGFANPQSFTKAFSKFHNVPPKTFVKST